MFEPYNAYKLDKCAKTGARMMATLTKLTVSEAREEFADLVNRACYTKERVTVTRRGKGVAAIVPLEDLQLLLDLEAQVDLEDARAALKEAEVKGTVLWEDLKKELDL
ncbi:MAG: type II toxin-antitoxin system Phd/YefM family antitoxin [Candidatus Binatia bacterium]